MINCPNCGQELIPDAQDPNKLNCPGCGYSLNAAQNDYWGTSGVGASGAGAAQPLPTEPMATVPPAQANPCGQPGTQGAQSNPYGQPAAQGTQPYYGAPQPTLPKGMAIAALVLGILALLNCWIPVANIFAIVLGIIALILGILGANKASKGLAAGKGMAIAGIVMGAISILVAIIINIATAALMNYVLEDEEVQDSISAIVNEIDDEYGTDNGSQQGNSNDSVSGSTTYDDGATWAAMEFTLDGKTYKMGETTLDSLLSQSGWTVDADDTGYLTASLNPGDDSNLIMLEKAGSDDDFLVRTSNTTTGTLAARQCALVSLSFESDDFTGRFTISGGVGIGSTADQIITALGQPTEDTGNDYDGMRMLTYWTADYSKSLDLTLGENGKVEEITLYIF